MGARVIDAAFRELDEQPGLSAAEEAAIRGALAPDRDAAGEWVTEQLFTVIDGALPYVLGRDASFAVSVGFDDQPQLADPMGAFLDRNPERLLDEGYGYTDADLDALAASFGADGAARVQDELDQRLSIFREDFVWTEADLLADLRETQAEYSGGLLTHGAIVAREFGIPAVVGTGVATERIPDGATVTVDGDAGTVTVQR